MKYSRQRELIYQAVLGAKNHPTADQVCEQVRLREPNISLATVYRNLNQLAAHGAIRRVAVAGGCVHFDGRLDSHEHLICQRCGCLEDVELGQLESAMEEIRGVAGGRIRDYDLTLYGLCTRCAADEPGHEEQAQA